MSKISTYLSVDELALIFNYIGRHDLANDLVAARYGTIGKEEFGIRMVTVRNSFMARGLLSQERSNKQIFLDESLVQIGHLIADAKYSIWCSRNTLEKVDHVSYHFNDKIIVENKLENDVVHCLTGMNDIEQVIQNISDLYEIQSGEEFTAPRALIPNLALTEFLEENKARPILERLDDPELLLVNLDPKENIKYFKDPKYKKAIPDSTRKMFAEDWEKNTFWGVIMYIEHEPFKAPLFDRGVLILHGSKRYWIMKPAFFEGETAMEVFPLTTKNFNSEMKSLLV